MSERCLTTGQIAELLQVSTRHVARLRKRDGLPAFTVGTGQWRYDRDEVIAWAKSRTTGRPRVQAAS